MKIFRKILDELAIGWGGGAQSDLQGEKGPSMPTTALIGRPQEEALDVEVLASSDQRQKARLLTVDQNDLG